MIITIDGPAGVGKSTVAHKLAHRLGLDFLDTGAMYRATALVALEEGIDPHDGPGVAAAIERADMHFDFGTDPPRIMLGSRDVSVRIRDADVNVNVSAVAAQPEVRAALVARQRAVAEEHPRLVTEGRDQGSVVFPDARLKLFLSADVQIRAQRRADQLRDSGRHADNARVAEEIQARDRRDSAREDSPLVKPQDAVEIDTTDRSADQVVDEAVALSRDAFPEAGFE
ncbi:MAG: (d)CMP kinase [Planctomycetota bacterium]